jgi:hypothetical protein
MKQLLFFSLLSISSGLLAQPVLTAADHMTVGDGYTSYVANNPSGLDTTTTGPNSVWNFSGLTSSGTSQITYLNPNTQPGFSNFSDANLAFQSVTAGGSPTYTFINLESDELALNGLYVAGSTTSIVDYDPNLATMVFPFTYNSNVNRPLQGTTLANGITIYRQGTNNIRYDGFGTLTTPAGTFEDVVRYRIDQRFTDSLNVQGFISISNYRTIAFIWTNAERKLAPLMSWSILETDFGPSVNASWVDPEVLSVNSPNSTGQAFIYPNPASKQFNIGNLNQTEPTIISVIDLSGRIVYDQSSTGSTAQVYVPNLDAGVYMIKIQTAQSSEMHRVVLQ